MSTHVGMSRMTIEQLNTLTNALERFSDPAILVSDSQIFYANQIAQVEFGIDKGDLVQRTTLKGILQEEQAEVTGMTDQHITYQVRMYDLSESLTTKLYICFPKSEDEDKEEETNVSALPKTSVLIQQEKLAGIGQMAAGVAHEIFNPLGYVLSNFETLKSYFDDILHVVKDSGAVEKNADLAFVVEDIGELFRDVDEGLNRVISIISSLKGFVRESEDILEYDLNEGIRNTLLIARNEYKYHAEVITKLGDIPTTQVNGNKINQVILNILVNAVHAIQQAHGSDMGKIRIESFHKSGMVGCSISDNGIGMEQEQAEKIFQPFFTTKPEGVGTGLGLSIAWDIIVEQHNGTLDVRSVPGQGTTFTIQLPVIESEENDEEESILSGYRR